MIDWAAESTALFFCLGPRISYTSWNVETRSAVVWKFPHLTGLSKKQTHPLGLQSCILRRYVDPQNHPKICNCVIIYIIISYNIYIYILYTHILQSCKSRVWEYVILERTKGTLSRDFGAVTMVLGYQTANLSGLSCDWRAALEL